MPKNRSMEPNSARWISTGRCREPSAAVYSSPNRSGMLKSSWIVDICQLRPSASSHLHRDLRPVERRTAGIRHQFQATGFGDLAQRPVASSQSSSEPTYFSGSLVDSSRKKSSRP